MPRVLLLATTTGYQTRAFGDAAARVGVDLVFATDRCHLLEDPWQDQAIPIRFYEEEASIAAILESARARPIDGVLVVGDRPAVIGARVMQALGLPGHSPEAAAAAGNKQRTRERLRDHGLPVPWFLPAPIDANPAQLAGSIAYPCVVKPQALSGSRGVMRADDADGFVTAFERLRTLLRAPDIRAERRDVHDTILVEGFIEGREYALEGLLEHGVLRVLALFDKPDPLDGPFFEETIYVTPSAAPEGIQTAIVSNIARAAAAIGLRHGPIHAECRVNDRGVFVLEVAARPIGGLCARVLLFHNQGERHPVSTQRESLRTSAGGGEAALANGGEVLQHLPERDGLRSSARGSEAASAGGGGAPREVQGRSLEELLLRHALGGSASDWIRESRASGVMMIPIPRRGVFRRVERLAEAREVAGIDDLRITAKADQLLLPLPEGASYLGFIFARGPLSEDVEEALRRAHARLGFVIDPELPVLAAAQIHYNRFHG